MEQKLDKIKYIKRVIIVCWVALAICFVIKLFGGNFFQIICENQTFIAVCEFCDNNWWASYIIGCLNTFVCEYLFVLSICRKSKFELWELIVVTATVIVGTAIKRLDAIVGFVFDIWQFIGMPLIFIRKELKSRWWIILVANALLIVFQLASMFTKNIGFGIITSNNGLVIGLIYSIDITIMLILYFLYSLLIKTKKEN